MTVDKAHFYEAIYELGTICGIVLSEARVDGYWKWLGSFDADLFDKTVATIMLTDDHFPSVARFRMVARDAHNKEIDGRWVIRT